MVSIPGFGGREVVEELVDLGKMEPRTCKSLPGMLDERGHCFIKLERDPTNPNISAIKKMEYVPSGVTPVHTVEGSP